MANSPATSLKIFELSGEYQVILTDRALPYRPVTFTGKQRAEFTWYPGSPVATAQMLGPEEQAFTLKGFWKERFIAVPLSPAVIAASDVFGTVGVQSLVGVFDTMRRRGQLCQFTWDSIERVGYITSFTQTWHNRYDCEWELEFTPISQGEQQVPQVINPMPDVGSAAAAWQDGAYNLNRAFGISVGASEPPPYSLADTIAATLNVLDDTVLEYSNAVTGAVQNVTQQVLAGPDALNRIIALGEGMKRSTAQTLTSVVEQADGSLFPLLNVDQPDDINLSTATTAAVYKYTVRAAVLALRNAAIEQQEEYGEALDPQLLQTFIAPKDIDLRDVSTQFYGEPNQWRVLMLFNRLDTSRVAAGTLLFIPQLGSSGVGITAPGAQGARA